MSETGVTWELRGDKIFVNAYGHEYDVKQIVLYKNGWMDLMLEISYDVYKPIAGNKYQVNYKEHRGWPPKPQNESDRLLSRCWFVYTKSEFSELGYRMSIEVDEVVKSGLAYIVPKELEETLFKHTKGFEISHLDLPMILPGD